IAHDGDQLFDRGETLTRLADCLNKRCHKIDVANSNEVMIHEGRQAQGESQFTLEPAEPGIRQCTRNWCMPGPKLLYSSGQSQGSAIVASPLPSGRWVDSALLFCSCLCCSVAHCF